MHHEGTEPGLLLRDKGKGVNRSRVLRARRSSLVTNSTSPSSRAFSNRWSCARSVLAPLATSLKTLSDPAWASCATCAATLGRPCSLVHSRISLQASPAVVLRIMHIYYAQRKASETGPFISVHNLNFCTRAPVCGSMEQFSREPFHSRAFNTASHAEVRANKGLRATCHCRIWNRIPNSVPRFADTVNSTVLPRSLGAIVIIFGFSLLGVPPFGIILAMVVWLVIVEWWYKRYRPRS